MATGAAPENRDDRGFVVPRDVTHRHDVEVSQLLGRDLADAPQLLDRQGMQELGLALRRHSQQSVGFRECTGDLGQELGACDSDRDR